MTSDFILTAFALVLDYFKFKFYMLKEDIVTEESLLFEIGEVV